MTIKQIYDQLGIPPNLAEHMFRVASVAMFLRDHWTGDQINWDKVKKTALLHDVGNIVKSDFDKYPEFLGDEIKRIDYWKQKQKEVIAKYGSDDHEATNKMLTGIGVDKEIIEVILRKSFGNSVETANSDDWYPKLLYYSDLRVLPQGIGTLEDRIEDVKVRMPKYTGRSDFPQLVAACREIERQIQENVKVPVANLTNDSIRINQTKYLEAEI